jgi:uncharacterized protein involved in exopolysaccharide biosynthesis
MRPLARWWKLVLAVLLFGIMASAALVLRMPQLYDASTLLALSGAPAPPGAATAINVRAIITTPSALANAAAVAHVERAALTNEAVFVDPMPQTAFVRLRVRQRDASVAARLADALAREAVQRSRALREQGQEPQTMDEVRVNDALAAWRAADQTVVDFRSRARIEVLAAEVAAALPGPQSEPPRRTRALPSGAAINDKLDELYRRETELIRLRTEAEIARLRYVDAARLASTTTILAVPQIFVTETNIPPGQPVPMERWSKIVFGAGISLLLAVLLPFLIEGGRRSSSFTAP